MASKARLRTATGAMMCGLMIAGAVAVGALSGGAFNPAVALGIMTFGLSAWKNIWIYLVAEAAGAALAGATFKVMNPSDP